MRFPTAVFSLTVWSMLPLFAVSQGSTASSQESTTNRSDVWAEGLAFAISSIRDNYAYSRPALDWQELEVSYESKLGVVKTDLDFFHLVEQLVEELHDHHAHLNSNDSNSFRLVPTGTDVWAVFAEGAFWIADVREGSAAEEAGLRGGLRLIAVDGEDVELAVEKRLSEFIDRDSELAKSWAVRTLIAGQHHQKSIALTTENSRGVVRDYVYTRGWAPEGKGPLKRFRKSGDTYHIRIEDSLGQGELVAPFDAAIEWAKDAKTVVLDLTNTPSGGNSDIARAILGHFTADEMPYQRHEFIERPLGVPRIWLEHVAPRGDAPFLGKLLVLVNHWTGSMGEGVAIALDTLPNATVIGTQMAGLKGATERFDLPNANFGFYLPTQRLSHVDGTPRESFLPEVLVNPVSWDKTSKKLKDEVDRQLMAGSAQGRWLDEIPSWIKSTGHELKSLEPAFPASEDLEWLKERMSEVRVLGLGEATHGTSEFFTVRHRLTRYLVEHADFNVVAFESSAAAAVVCDRYIRGEEVTIEEAMGGLRMSIWQVEEVRALLVDLRSLNEERETPVRFFGVDMQSPHMTTGLLLSTLSEIDPALGAKWAEPLERFLILVRGKSEDEEAETLHVQASLDELHRLWDENATPYSAHLGAERFAETKRQMKALDQNMIMFTSSSWGHRDAGMAENTLGIFDVLGEEAKVLLWAHNGHVFNGRLTYTPEQSPSMGGQLKQTLGEGYYAMGLFFNRGTFQANGYNEEGKLNFKRYHFDVAPFGSLEHYFAGANVNATILDLAARPEGKAVAEWFNHPHGVRLIGGYNVMPDVNLRTRDAAALMSVNLDQAYDGILYVDHTTPAEPLDKSMIDPVLYGD